MNSSSASARRCSPSRAGQSLHNNNQDFITRIAHQYSLPPQVLSLARSVLHALAHPSDQHLPPGALFIALLSYSPLANPPALSVLLPRDPTPDTILSFYAQAVSMISDLPSTVPVPPSVVHTIRDAARGLKATHDVFRKLHQLAPHLGIRNVSLSWIAFATIKLLVLPPANVPMSTGTAFHFMLAALLEAGLFTNIVSFDSLADITNAVRTEVARFRTAIREALPGRIVESFPLSTGDPKSHFTMFNDVYNRHIRAPSRRLIPDDRLFLKQPKPVLRTPPPTPPQPRNERRATMGLSTPSPSRKRRATAQLPHTPRTRRDLLRDKMSVTPTNSGRFSHIVTRSSGADALDALAAVASSAPPSPTVSTGTRQVPATPVSTACRMAGWLKKLVDERMVELPKDPGNEPDSFKEKFEMLEIVGDQNMWKEIVDFADKATTDMCNRVPMLGSRFRKREAMSVFIASLESLLVREKERLKEKPAWIMKNLVKAISLRKALMCCSWEVVSTSYGRRDMRLFTTAIDLYKITPLDVIKVIEPFVKMKGLPRVLISHIILCGNRIVDSMVWRSESKLVEHLKNRAEEKARERTERESQEQNRTGKTENVALPDAATGRPTVATIRDFTLEYIYKKMLAVASERAQDLLMRLGMDAIAEYVWATIKFAVWEKWFFMLDRHLDQIIMCSIYGIAKVRRYDLKFREIITAYTQMPHVRDPSCGDLNPTVFRVVCLEPHLDLQSPEERAAAPEAMASLSGTKGDIIRFYNKIFIQSMKPFLLKYQLHPKVNNPGQKHSQRTQSRAIGTSDLSIMPGNVRRNRSEPQSDRLNNAVMNSPMRQLKPYASPRRIGRVTVSPMSPRGPLMALRQSPSRRVSNLMTPNTKTLYAFGESPVKSLEHMNRRARTASRAKALNMEGTTAAARVRVMREHIAKTIMRRSAVRRSGECSSDGAGNSQAQEAVEDPNEELERELDEEADLSNV